MTQQDFAVTPHRRETPLACRQRDGDHRRALRLERVGTDHRFPIRDWGTQPGGERPIFGRHDE